MPTRLFTGWMVCMAAVALSKLMGHTLYDFWGGYVDWIGGISFSLFGLIFMLQFAYRFPRPAYPREARLVFAVSLGLTASVLALVAYEASTPPIYPLYDFEQFIYGVLHSRYEHLLTSVNSFECLHPLGYLWAALVWLRQIVTFSKDTRRPLPSLWRPPDKESRAARAFAALMFVVLLPVIVSGLEARRIVPVGSLTTTYLLTIFVLVSTYLNYSPEPSSFLVKLVGIVLVALLAFAGTTNLVILNLHREAYDQARRAELDHIKTIAKTNGAGVTLVQAGAEIPPGVLYIVTRPTGGGLFPPTYRLLFSRQPGLAAQTFSKQEAYFKAGLERPTVQLAVLHENPWLRPDQVKLPAAGQVAIPQAVLSYRGVYARPEQQLIRYTFRLDDALYEVGYSYLGYRQMLHQKAIPLVCLTLATALIVLLVFPLFFRANLIEPLQDLLRGVTQINAGNLNATVPVRVEDEIGFLARSFNGMVRSLQTLNASLRQEIAERRRAEAEVQALNATLEQRVTDRTRELAALYQVSAVASQALDLPTLLAEALSRTMAALDSNGGAVYLLEEALPRLAAHQGCLPDVLLRLDSLPAGDGLLGLVVEQREPLLIPNVSADPRTPDLIRQAGALTLILVPLQAGGQVVGVLGLVRRPGQTFNLEEIALLSSIADQMGQAVESDRLHQLARQASVLEERHRIARDLHDSITQSLYGLATLTEAGQAQLESGATDAIGRILVNIGDTTRQALREMRLFIHQLRPPELEQEGLAAALHQRLAAVEGRSNIQARLLVDEMTALSLPSPVQQAFYRIANEALNNALRHARASEVTIYLSGEAGHWTLSVVDNGCGFDPHASDAGGMGLLNMQEHAAQVGGVLTITSAPGAGTSIEVKI